MRVGSVCPIAQGRGAAPTGNRLVVGERKLRARRMNSAEGEVVHRALAGRGNSLRSRSRKGAEQRVHHPLRGFDIATGNRGGKHSIHNCAAWGNHSKRTQESGSCWYVIAHQTAEYVVYGGDCDGFDGIHVSGALRSRSRKIHNSGIRFDSNTHANSQWLVADSIAIEKIFRAICSGPQRANHRLHHFLGIIEQVFRIELHLRQSVLCRYLAQSTFAETAGGNLRGEVTLPFPWSANVCEQQAQEFADDVSPAKDLYRRDAEPFLKYFPGRSHRASQSTTDVGVMSATGHEELRFCLGLYKHRHHERQIR